MSNVQVIDAVAAEAREDDILLLIEDEREEALDRRRGNVVAVRTLNQRLRALPRQSLSCTALHGATHLPLEVQNRDQRAPHREVQRQEPNVATFKTTPSPSNFKYASHIASKWPQRVDG